MPREAQLDKQKGKAERSSIVPYSQLNTKIASHAVCITQPCNDTGQEERNGVYSAVCAKVDENHNIELGVLEGFPDIFSLESHFPVGIISRQPHYADFPLTTGEAP